MTEEPQEERKSKMFGAHWTVLGRLQDLREECHEKGEHEKCKQLDQIIEAPRRKRRAMMRGLVAEIEMRAVPIDFWNGDLSDRSEGILDLIQWLLENVDTIFALITKIIDLFSEAEGNNNSGSNE